MTCLAEGRATLASPRPAALGPPCPDEIWRQVSPPLGLYGGQALVVQQDRDI